MIKRITLFLLIGLSIAGIYFTVTKLQQKTEDNLPIINCIPKDAAIILEIEKPIKMWSLLSTTNVLWNDLKNIPYFDTLDNDLKNIDSILQLDTILMQSKIEKKGFVSIHPSNEKPSILVAFSLKENVFNKMVSKYNITENENGFYKIEGNKPLYITYHSPFTVIATSKELLSNSINQLQKKESILDDEVFVKIRKTINKGSNVHIYTNAINLKKMILPFVKKEWIENWKIDEIWTVYDLILNNNTIILNGLSLSIQEDNIVTSSKLIDANLLPPNIVSINEYTISKEGADKVLKQINNDCNCNVEFLFERWIGNHLTEFSFDKGLKAIVIPTKTADGFLEDLSEIVKIDTTVYEVFGTEIHRIFSSSFSQLSGFSADDIYFYHHNSNLVFSSYKGLKQLMFFWRKSGNRDSESVYNTFSENMMAQKSTTSHYANLEYVASKGFSILKPAYQETFSRSVELLRNRLDFAYQTNELNNDYLHQAIIVQSNSKTQLNSSLLWELNLKNKITFGPKLVKNHKSKSLDVLVQDTTNTIYLINAFGEIKWSKKIEGSIRTRINQIDLFGNNKYQLVFNTDSKIYLLDINGNTVSGFPITLPSPATSPVSVFDNQNSNAYHFWISCANKITYSFDKAGQFVSDWTNPKSMNLIANSFQSVSLENQNYFYNLDQNGKLYFLNEKGEEVLQIDTTLNPKKNKLYFQKRASLLSSSFIYVCDSTNVIKDYTLGNNLQTSILDSNNTFSTLEVLDLKADNYLDYLSFSQNSIEVYGPDKTLVNRNEYLFNIEEHYALIKSTENKDYIILQDEDTQELLILNANLTQLNRSTIIGDLNVAIGDLNADGKLNLTCRNTSNSIVAYKLR